MSKKTAQSYILKCNDCFNNDRSFCNCVRFSGIDSKPDMFNKSFDKVVIKDNHVKKVKKSKKFKKHAVRKNLKKVNNSEIKIIDKTIYGFEGF